MTGEIVVYQYLAKFLPCFVSRFKQLLDGGPRHMKNGSLLIKLFIPCRITRDCKLRKDGSIGS